MTIVIPIPALVGGMAAALLYGCVARGWIVGITAPLLPVFILALAGTCYGRAGATIAALSAAVSLLFLMPVTDALLTITMQVIPVALFTRSLMVAMIDPTIPAIRWAPLGHGVAMVSAYGALYHAAVIGTNSSLFTLVKEQLGKQAAMGADSGIDPEMALAMEHLVQTMPHVLFALEFWLWVVLLVMIVVLAQWVAESLKLARRPDMRLAIHTPPNALLVMLAGAGLMGFVQIDAVMQAGQAAGLILLLPYFFSGLGIVHDKLRGAPAGRFWLAGFYLVTAITLWPLACVTLFGLMRHLGRYTLLVSPPKS